jgi:hypothetical protein
LGNALFYKFNLLDCSCLLADWVTLYKLNLLGDHFGYFRPELFVVVVDHLHLGEDFAAAELIYFVGEGVGRCVGLQSQLQLGHRLLLDGDLQRHVGDGDGVVEPALHLNQSVVIGVTPDELPDFVDCCDDVLDGAEDALSPDHVADGEGH